jgi:S-adenosylmethionine hydrolase
VDQPIIGLLTDFGDDDFFVASLKGVIARINPKAHIIDITHRAPSFRVLSGGFILFAAYRYFPPKTIFLTVVDPGVGSSRKILCVETKNYYFIGPDNGVLSMALEQEDLIQIRYLSNAEYFLPQPTQTFEARDKMAPVAAWLSQGTPCEKFGPKVVSYNKLNIQKPVEEGNNLIGTILHIDKFGNLITNIPSELLTKRIKRFAGALLRMKMAQGTGEKTSGPESLEIGFHKTYGEADKGEAICLTGSLGLLEIAVREGSAADCLEASVGHEITLSLKSER